MKKQCLIFTILCLTITLSTSLTQAQEGVIISNHQNNVPDSSAMFEVKTTTGGILIPRMTVTQRIAINDPAEGLMIYQTDDVKGFYYFDGTVWVSVGNTAKEYAVFEDRKPDGTKGGKAVVNQWTTCLLNHTHTLIGQSISRIENTITLHAGTYLIEASSPGLYCHQFQIRFWNSTNNTTALLGTNAYDEEYNNIFGRTQTRSFIKGIVIIQKTTNYKIEYWRNGSILSDWDLGVSNPNSEDEIYTRIYIEKLR